MSDTPISAAADHTPHEPFISPQTTNMPEFTLRAVLVGAVLGVIFGASSLYLVLKVGMSVSASIPVAVISVTLSRIFSRLTGLTGTTILENNIVQTTGSAGESIAFGVGVTMPALLLLGFDMELWRVMMVALLGGVLGILMMIPLRRAFVVKLHGNPGEPGKLLYPEGTACAEVLISGEKGGASGELIILGFALAFLHKFFTDAFQFLRDALSYPLAWFSKVAVLSTGMDAALLGVGYIIGPRTACTMMAGAVMGYLVLVPTMYTFGEHLTETLPPATSGLIKDMSPKELRLNYLLFIGAGCVAAAGIISMFRTTPMIIRTVQSGIASLRGAGGRGILRTERDMPIQVTLVGSVAMVAILAIFMSVEVNIVAALIAALLIIFFGFLFVLVSSRLTGEIGSSSNPISGMTIATLLLTCLIFLTMKMTGPTEQVLALTIGAVVCIAASNAGTTSQDLKTGFLVGATPIYQQYALLAGALTSALCIGVILLWFNTAGTIYSAKDLPTLNVDAQIAKIAMESGQPPVALEKKETYQSHEYRVLRVSDSNGASWPGVEKGKYLVDSDGSIKYLVDPTITGRLDHRDDGSKATFKFEAPKTRVMQLVVSGVLGGNMNWGLILLGVCVTIVLELCGLPALPFAVGMYISMADTAPIFLGGLVRFAVDLYKRWRAGGGHLAKASAIAAESESSPGVLLSSGYVAGATLAGVVIAFLNIPVTDAGKKWIDLLDYHNLFGLVASATSAAPAAGVDMWAQFSLSATTLIWLGLMGLLFYVATKREKPQRGFPVA